MNSLTCYAVEHEIKLLAPTTNLVALETALQSHREASLLGTALQCAIFWDTSEARLAALDSSLSLVINPSPDKAVRWLVAKETLNWSSGIRNALEIGVRVGGDAVQIASEVMQHSVPARRARRVLADSEAALRPLMWMHQRRTKWAVVSGGAPTLEVSLDDVHFGLFDARDSNSRRVRLIEIEANNGGLVEITAIGDIAAELEERLETTVLHGTKYSLGHSMCMR